MGNSPFIRVLHEIRLLRVPRSAAVRARDLHVWQELDIQADHACSVTSRAAEFSRIVGEIPGLIPTYSNLAIITHSDDEFILDFANMLPGMPKPGVRSRIIMTPKHAKRLLHALSDNIQKYESHFGAIDMSDKRPNQNEATFNLGDLAAFNNGTKS